MRVVDGRLRDIEGRTDAMAATIRMRQLQKDVTDVEEAELRRGKSLPCSIGGVKC